MNEQIYQSLINDANEENKNRHQRQYIFRTSMLHGCERKILYSVLGYGEFGEFNPQNLLTLNIGTMVHEVVQGALVRNGWITNCEKETVLPKYSLNGHRDGDTYIDDNNQILPVNENRPVKYLDQEYVNFIQGKVLREPNSIFELKTINAQGFMRLFWNKSAKPEHIHQVNTYMGLTGYKKAVIVYVNKNGIVAYNDKESMLKWPKEADTYIQSFIVDFDETMWLETQNKLANLNKLYSENKTKNKEDHNLPDKLPSGNKECNYCQFKAICKPPRKKKTEEERAEQTKPKRIRKVREL